MFPLGLIALFVFGCVADEGPLVQTSLGKIRGYYKTSFGGRVYSAFEGIPYAKPPVGDLRFEAPQPVSPWSNELNANTTCWCKQAKTAFMPVEGIQDTEDCLYLNVYAPKTETLEDKNYDVIVNIHGGAFIIGSAAFAGSRGLMERDIVYVNLNYRLGILGFLSTEDNVVPGNNGLKDQQMALKWVQSHIQHFGGNPNSVTLMGLSAGGISVHFHYFSPQSRGLFHRGISQSGTALIPPALQKNALQKTKKIAESLNCQNSDMQKLINCLKTIDVDILQKELNQFFDIFLFPLAPFAPVVEVKSNFSFLTEQPYKLLEKGEVYDVPWLTWITKDEGIMAAMIIRGVLHEVETNWNEWSQHLFDYKDVCPENRKKDVAEKIKSFYLNNDQVSEDNLKKLVEIFSDRLFRTGFESAVKMQSEVNRSPTYAAIYNYVAKTPANIDTGIEGVPHGADGVLIHDVPDALLRYTHELSEADVYMRDVLVDLATSFAKDGKPKLKTLDWEPFTTHDPNYLFINSSDDLTMAKIPKLSPIDFWNSLGFTENIKAERIREEL